MALEVRSAGSFYVLSWPEHTIEIHATRVMEHRDGRTSAELRVLHRNETGLVQLTQGQLNLSAPRTRIQWAKDLAETEGYETLPWREMLEEGVAAIIRLHRQGEPVQEVNTALEIQQPRFFLSPLLPELQPTVVFGAGESGKSIVALMVAIVGLLPWRDNPLGLQPTEYAPFLWLDWETDYAEISWRTKCLERGMGLPNLFFQYRRCYRPLADDLEEIQRIVMEEGIKLLVIDSLGLACGDDLDKSEGPKNLFAALRQLGVTSLIIAHETKKGKEQRGIYGSVFFFNLARSVWHITRYDREDPRFDIVLKQVKSNNSSRKWPLAFSILFPDGGPLTLQKISLEDIPEHLENLPLAARIMEALKPGKRKVETLIDEFVMEGGPSESLLRKTLTQLKRRGQVVNPARGEWGLAQGVQPVFLPGNNG